MNIVVFLVIAVLVIDFLSIHKHDFKVSVVYIGIVSLIVIVYILDNYDILERSPIETIIEPLTPLLDWISNTLRNL